MPTNLYDFIHVCVCVCVCVRERERERETNKGSVFPYVRMCICFTNGMLEGGKKGRNVDRYNDE